MSLKPRDYYARSRKDNERKRQKYAENPILYRRLSRIRRWKTKGISITYAQYESLLKEQNYCCAVCNQPQNSLKKDLAVDHDHSTNQIRGLLCLECNWFVVRVLEKYGDIIPKAEVYIKKWKGRK